MKPILFTCHYLLFLVIFFLTTIINDSFICAEEIELSIDCSSSSSVQPFIIENLGDPANTNETRRAPNFHLIVTPSGSCSTIIIRNSIVSSIVLERHTQQDVSLDVKINNITCIDQSTEGNFCITLVGRRTYTKFNLEIGNIEKIFSQTLAKTTSDPIGVITWKRLGSSPYVFQGSTLASPSSYADSSIVIFNITVRYSPIYTDDWNVNTSTVDSSTIKLYGIFGSLQDIVDSSSSGSFSSSSSNNNPPLQLGRFGLMFISNVSIFVDRPNVHRDRLGNARLEVAAIANLYATEIGQFVLRNVMIDLGHLTDSSITTQQQVSSSSSSSSSSLPPVQKLNSLSINAVSNLYVDNVNFDYDKSSTSSSSSSRVFFPGHHAIEISSIQVQNIHSYIGYHPGGGGADTESLSNANTISLLQVGKLDTVTSTMRIDDNNIHNNHHHQVILISRLQVVNTNLHFTKTTENVNSVVDILGVSFPAGAEGAPSGINVIINDERTTTTNTDNDGQQLPIPLLEISHISLQNVSVRKRNGQVTIRPAYFGSSMKGIAPRLVIDNILASNIYVSNRGWYSHDDDDGGGSGSDANNLKLAVNIVGVEISANVLVGEVVDVGAAVDLLNPSSYTFKNGMSIMNINLHNVSTVIQQESASIHGVLMKGGSSSEITTITSGGFITIENISVLLLASPAADYGMICDHTTSSIGSSTPEISCVLELSAFSFDPNGACWVFDDSSYFSIKNIMISTSSITDSYNSNLHNKNLLHHEEDEEQQQQQRLRQLAFSQRYGTSTIKAVIIYETKTSSACSHTFSFITMKNDNQVLRSPAIFELSNIIIDLPSIEVPTLFTLSPLYLNFGIRNVSSLVVSNIQTHITEIHYGAEKGDSNVEIIGGGLSQLLVENVSKVVLFSNMFTTIDFVNQYRGSSSSSSSSSAADQVEVDKGKLTVSTLQLAGLHDDDERMFIFSSSSSSSSLLSSSSTASVPVVVQIENMYSRIGHSSTGSMTKSKVGREISCECLRIHGNVNGNQNMMTMMTTSNNNNNNNMKRVFSIKNIHSSIQNIQLTSRALVLRTVRFGYYNDYNRFLGITDLTFSNISASANDVDFSDAGPSANIVVATVYCSTMIFAISQLQNVQAENILTDIHDVNVVTAWDFGVYRSAIPVTIYGVLIEARSNIDDFNTWHKIIEGPPGAGGSSSSSSSNQIYYRPKIVMNFTNNHVNISSVHNYYRFDNRVRHLKYFAVSAVHNNILTVDDQKQTSPVIMNEEEQLRRNIVQFSASSCSTTLENIRHSATNNFRTIQLQATSLSPLVPTTIKDCTLNVLGAIETNFYTRFYGLEVVVPSTLSHERVWSRNFILEVENVEVRFGFSSSSAVHHSPSPPPVREWALINTSENIRDQHDFISLNADQQKQQQQNQQQQEQQKERQFYYMFLNGDRAATVNAVRISGSQPTSLLVTNCHIRFHSSSPSAKYSYIMATPEAFHIYLIYGSWNNENNEEKRVSFYSKEFVVRDSSVEYQKSQQLSHQQQHSSSSYPTRVILRRFQTYDCSFNVIRITPALYNWTNIIVENVHYSLNDMERYIPAVTTDALFYLDRGVRNISQSMILKNVSMTRFEEVSSFSNNNNNNINNNNQGIVGRSTEIQLLFFGQTYGSSLGSQSSFYDAKYFSCRDSFVRFDNVSSYYNLGTLEFRLIFINTRGSTEREREALNNFHTFELKNFHLFSGGHTKSFSRNVDSITSVKIDARLLYFNTPFETGNGQLPSLRANITFEDCSVNLYQSAVASIASHVFGLYDYLHNLNNLIVRRVHLRVFDMHRIVDSVDLLLTGTMIYNASGVLLLDENSVVIPSNLFSADSISKNINKIKDQVSISHLRTSYNFKEINNCTIQNSHIRFSRPQDYFELFVAAGVSAAATQMPSVKNTSSTSRFFFRAPESTAITLFNPNTDAKNINVLIMDNISIIVENVVFDRKEHPSLQSQRDAFYIVLFKTTRILENVNTLKLTRLHCGVSDFTFAQQPWHTTAQGVYVWPVQFESGETGVSSMVVDDLSVHINNFTRFSPSSAIEVRALDFSNIMREMKNLVVRNVVIENTNGIDFRSGPTFIDPKYKARISFVAVFIGDYLVDAGHVLIEKVRVDLNRVTGYASPSLSSSSSFSTTSNIGIVWIDKLRRHREGLVIKNNIVNVHCAFANSVDSPDAALNVFIANFHNEITLSNSPLLSGEGEDNNNNDKNDVTIESNQIHFDTIRTRTLVSSINNGQVAAPHYLHHLSNNDTTTTGAPSNQNNNKFSSPSSSISLSKYKVAVVRLGSTISPLQTMESQELFTSTPPSQRNAVRIISNSLHPSDEVASCPVPSSRLENSVLPYLWKDSFTEVVFPVTILHLLSQLHDLAQDPESNFADLIVERNVFPSATLSEASILLFAKPDYSSLAPRLPPTLPPPTTTSSRNNTNNSSSPTSILPSSSLVLVPTSLNITLKQNTIYFDHENGGEQLIGNVELSHRSKNGEKLLPGVAWESYKQKSKDSSIISAPSADLSPYSSLSFTLNEPVSYPYFLESVILKRMFADSGVDFNFIYNTSLQSNGLNQFMNDYPEFGVFSETREQTSSSTKTVSHSDFTINNTDEITLTPNVTLSETRTDFEVVTQGGKPVFLGQKEATTTLAVASVATANPGTFQFTFKSKSIQQLASCDSAGAGYRVSKLDFESNPLSIRIPLKRPPAPPKSDTINSEYDDHGMISRRYNDEEYEYYIGSFVGNQIMIYVWLLLNLIICFALPYFENTINRKAWFYKKKKLYKKESEDKKKKNEKMKKQKAEEQEEDRKKKKKKSKNRSRSSSSNNRRNSDSDDDNDSDNDSVFDDVAGDDKRPPKKFSFSDVSYKQMFGGAQFPGSVSLLLGILGPSTSPQLGTLFGVGIFEIFYESEALVWLLMISTLATLLIIPSCVMFWTFYVIHTTKPNEQEMTAIINQKKKTSEKKIQQQSSPATLALSFSPAANLNHDFLQLDDDAIEKMNFLEKPEKIKGLKKANVIVQLWHWFMDPWLEWHDNDFVAMFGPFFDMFKNPLLPLFDFLVACAIGLASGIGQSCTTHKCCFDWSIVSLVAALLHLIAIFFLRPFLSRVDCGFYYTATIITAFDCILTVFALSEEVNNLEEGAESSATLENVNKIIDGLAMFSLIFSFLIMALELLKQFVPAGVWVKRTFKKWLVLSMISSSPISSSLSSSSDNGQEDGDLLLGEELLPKKKRSSSSKSKKFVLDDMNDDEAQEMKPKQKVQEYLNHLHDSHLSPTAANNKKKSERKQQEIERRQRIKAMKEVKLEQQRLLNDYHRNEDDDDDEKQKLSNPNTSRERKTLDELEREFETLAKDVVGVAMDTNPNEDISDKANEQHQQKQVKNNDVGIMERIPSMLFFQQPVGKHDDDQEPKKKKKMVKKKKMTKSSNKKNAAQLQPLMDEDV